MHKGSFKYNPTLVKYAVVKCITYVYSPSANGDKLLDVSTMHHWKCTQTRRIFFGIIWLLKPSPKIQHLSRQCLRGRMHFKHVCGRAKNS